MNIFSGLEEIVEKDYPLARCTWFGLGGSADYFIRPQTLEQLQAVMKRCTENNVAMRLLGFGSNLLVSDAGVKAAGLTPGGVKTGLSTWAL
jgi:UDP-N-acetylmuramate dehydrogenase